MDSNINNSDLTRTSQFDYVLPPELIAQKPIYPRDSSRLLVLDKLNGNISHDRFFNIVNYINPGDCLILNDSKVLPSRIYGTKVDTSASVEFLLLNQIEKNVWECLAKPGKKAKTGAVFSFGDGLLNASVIEVKEDGNRIIKFEGVPDFFSRLEKIGQMPLPPYIKETLKDQSRYQTVYAQNLGSAAAPTAGLHFTDNILQKLKNKGVKVGFITLHVGLGTFRPVKADIISEHKMHSEHFLMSKETADLINSVKKSGGKIIAAGTTVCRTLETIASLNGNMSECDGWTDIFIRPGYKFKAADALITNFHLPQSTLIMLVCAFAGYSNVMRAYKNAVTDKYRFFSFGDAMFIN